MIENGDLGDIDVTDFSVGSTIQDSYQYYYCVIGQFTELFSS